MATFFELSVTDRRDALGAASERTGRPAQLLEKDIMVVWALRTLFGSEHGPHLSFKGGTSLSKVYRLINRFSEDIDITYDIRQLLADLAIPDDGIPPTKSQGRKWTERVRAELPKWIGESVVPLFIAAATADGVKLSLRQEENDRLYLDYEPIYSSISYIRPSVMLEFGARSTGEPVSKNEVRCDAEAGLEGVELPVATAVRAMQIGRTFWEKATAAHVYAAQKSLKGDRFSRHWHDLHYIANSEYFEEAVSDLDLAMKVAVHKSFFFAEKDQNDVVIDYVAAVNGDIRLVPDGDALNALRADYSAMEAAGILEADAPTFDAVMESCARIQDRINGVEPSATAAGP